MSNLRIGYINLADLATLTADPVATTTGPVTFLQNDARGDIFQATSTAAQDLKGTWNGTAYTVSQLTLWRHNLAATDTIRIVLYSDVAWTTVLFNSDYLAAYTSGLFDNWGWGFYNYYFTPVAAVKSFRVTITTSAAALQCARLGLFNYTEAPINPQYGFVLTPENNSVQSRSEGGSLRSIRKADWRTAAFDMLVKTEADRAIWYEISRYCGSSKSFVASLFPEAAGTSERDHTLFAKFEGKPPAAKLAGYGRYDFSLKIQEL